MKTNLIALAFAACLSAQAYATTYICQVDGRAAYSTEKINKTCQVSRMDGISDNDDEVNNVFDGNTVTNAYSHKPMQVWGKKSNAYDDVKIIPSIRSTTPTSAPTVNVKLRNKVAANNKYRAPVIKPPKNAPVIASSMSAPAPKPQLSRKQILQNEIRNEKAALVRTQAQLNVVRKKGDMMKAKRLEQDIRDRKANIQAIQNEMSR